MRVYETQVPGVGTRFRAELDRGAALTVLVRDDGRREVYWRPDEDTDSERLFAVPESAARHLAEILDGTYVETPEDHVGDLFDDAAVEWVELDDDAPIVGATLGESALRSRTGVTVLAVQRGDRTTPTPGVDFAFRPGDVLVVAGDRDAHDRLKSLLAGESVDPPGGGSDDGGA
jgi:TrkA domain protein